MSEKYSSLEQLIANVWSERELVTNASEEYKKLRAMDDENNPIKVDEWISK